MLENTGNIVKIVGCIGFVVRQNEKAKMTIADIERGQNTTLILFLCNLEMACVS